MDIRTLRTDSARIEGGIWVGDIPGMGDLRLLVRGFTSASYRAALQAAQRGIGRSELNRDGTTPPVVADRITASAMGKGILLGWEGLEEDGKAVPFSVDTAVALLTDPDLRVFRDAVAFAAAEADTAKKDGEAQAVGNSSKSLTGTSDGAPKLDGSSTHSTTAA